MSLNTELGRNTCPGTPKHILTDLRLSGSSVAAQALTLGCAPVRTLSTNQDQHSFSVHVYGLKSGCLDRRAEGRTEGGRGCRRAGGPEY